MDINPSEIILRPFNLTDVDDLMLFFGDDRVTQNLPLTFIKDDCIPHPWRRSICISGHSIGCISVFLGSNQEDKYKAFIGYGVAPQYWGQGVATQALKIAVPLVFKDFPDLLRLQALVFVENKGSHMVLEKAGFQKEGLLRKYSFVKGVLRDLYIYSFLSTDFSSPKEK
ncbi:hypothetical protein UlMin_030113 [Ulmus minor]